MATYAIGDLQGCLTEFKSLLEKIDFNSKKDRLWLVGDVVNRGPDSLSTLKFLMDLSESVTMVLGNHDLHLIKLVASNEKASEIDTLNETLTSQDIFKITDWLRKKPLFHSEEDYSMVHAGLLPQWNITQIKLLAKEVETHLAGNNWRSFLKNIYGNKPDSWDEKLENYERWRVIINAFTRLRVCTANGKMNFTFKGSLNDLPHGYMPWFDVPTRRSKKTTIIFGHWSALGLSIKRNIISLDTGCVWGRSLSAIRLEDRKVFQASCGK